MGRVLEIEEREYGRALLSRQLEAVRHEEYLASKESRVSLLIMHQPRFIPLAVAVLALFDCAAMAQPPSTPRTMETGVEGVISAGPIRGGPSRQGVPDSRPLANIEFAVTKETSLVASFTTDDQGRFRIFLSPGHYIISRKDWNASIGSYGPFEIDVAASEMKMVRWECDTGLR